MFKKLLLLLALAVSPLAAQTFHYPALETTNTWQGPNTFTSTTTTQAPQYDININGVPNAIACISPFPPTSCGSDVPSWLTYSASFLPSMPLASGAGTAHMGEIGWGPASTSGGSPTWYSVGTVPTPSAPSGSPFKMTAQTQLDCHGGGFMVYGPVGLVIGDTVADGIAGLTNSFPRNYARNYIHNCRFYEMYTPPSTAVTGEQCTLGATSASPSSCVFNVASTTGFVLNEIAMCEGCLANTQSYPLNHNRAQVSAIGSNTITLSMLGLPFNKWNASGTGAVTITVTPISGGASYCGPIFGADSTWVGTSLTAASFTNGGNNGSFSISGFTTNCLLTNNATAVSETNNTGGTLAVQPPPVTESTAYTGTWTVSSPDSNGHVKLTGVDVPNCYGGYVNKPVAGSGFSNAGNNGTFTILACEPGSVGFLLINNPSAVAETTAAATMTVSPAILTGESTLAYVGGDPTGVNSDPTASGTSFSFDHVTMQPFGTNISLIRPNFGITFGNHAWGNSIVNSEINGAGMGNLFTPRAGGITDSGEVSNISGSVLGAALIGNIMDDNGQHWSGTGSSCDYAESSNTYNGATYSTSGGCVYGYLPHIDWDGGHMEQSVYPFFTTWGGGVGQFNITNGSFYVRTGNGTNNAIFQQGPDTIFATVTNTLLDGAANQTVAAWFGNAQAARTIFNKTNVYSLTSQLAASIQPAADATTSGHNFNVINGLLVPSLLVMPSPGDTITINGTTVTFVVSGATGNQVNIGADINGTITNLRTFVNASTDINIGQSTAAGAGANIQLVPKTAGYLESFSALVPQQWSIPIQLLGASTDSRATNIQETTSGLIENPQTTSGTLFSYFQPNLGTNTNTVIMIGVNANTKNAGVFGFRYQGDQNDLNGPYMGTVDGQASWVVRHLPGQNLECAYLSTGGTASTKDAAGNVGTVKTSICYNTSTGLILYTDNVNSTPYFSYNTATENVSLGVTGKVVVMNDIPTMPFTATPIASAAAIVPTTQVFYVSGTTPIATITPTSVPACSLSSTNSCMLVLIPQSTGGSTLTTGNISNAVNFTVDTPVLFFRDQSVNKWKALTAGGGSGSSVANIAITVSSFTAAANSCYDASGTLNAVSTATMTGLTTTMAPHWSFTANPRTLVGWGSTGGMNPLLWPSATNTLSYEFCNPTGGSIVVSAATLNVGAP